MAGFVSGRNERAGNENLNVGDNVFPTTQITVLDEAGEEVGYIQDLTETQDRAVEPIRHLNAADAGRIVQGVPRPANYTVSVTGFAIYKQAADLEGSVLSRLVANSGNANKLMKSLEEQKIPFFIKVETVNPNGLNSTTVYHMCWITRYSRPYSINNAFIAETADIFVGYVDEV